MNKMKVITSFRNGKRWGEALFLALLLLYPVSMHADEGMWMLGNLNKETRKTMKELGLQMPPTNFIAPGTVSERRCGQFRRILFGSSRLRRWLGVYQSPLRIQQHTATQFGGS